MRLSQRIEAVAPSRTVQFTRLLHDDPAKALSVINFAVGEPHTGTPQPVIAATKQALDKGKTRYGPVRGLKSLRTLISEQFDGYREENIIVANGSKQLLYGIMQVICDPLDEVIIPRPFWVSFSEQVKLASAVPIYVDTVDHQLDLTAISNAMTNRTRAIIINSPNNPTGAVYSQEDLRQVADIAISKDLTIISDEAYHDFMYENEAHKGFGSMADIRDRLVVVRSFSKTFDMTGFRVGYMAAPQKVITAMSRLQSHLSGNVCTFSQEGALAALSLSPSLIKEKQRQFQKKRDMAFDLARELFDCIKPMGAFYLFPNIGRHLSAGQTSEGFAARLLEKGGVAVVPGSAFGMEGHIRISYAVSDKHLAEGFERIAGVL